MKYVDKNYDAGPGKGDKSAEAKDKFDKGYDRIFKKPGSGKKSRKVSRKK